MSSRTSSVYASAASGAYEPYTPSSSSSSSSSIIYGGTSKPARKTWVDPASLRNCGDASQIQGNVSAHVKQLILNTFIVYGAGDEQCFGHHVAKAVKFVDISAYDSKEKHGRMEAVTIAEVVVNKSKCWGWLCAHTGGVRVVFVLTTVSPQGMLNGAGMLHGGCLAFLIDNCCSTPLVALGLIQNVNGVGVTQAMNVIFHSPAPA